MSVRAELRVALLQAKDRRGSQANHQKLGGRLGADSPSQPRVHPPRRHLGLGLLPARAETADFCGLSCQSVVLCYGSPRSPTQPTRRAQPHGPAAPLPDTVQPPHRQPPTASCFCSFDLTQPPRATSSKNPLLNFPLNFSCISPTAECLIALYNYFLCELFCLPGFGREGRGFDTF